MLNADSSFQIRHLHCRQCRLETLVAHLQTSTVDGLLQRLAGEDAEGVWNAGFLRRLPDATGDFVDDDVVVSSVSAKQAAEADDGIVFTSFGEGASGGGNFKRAGNADDGDVFPRGT